MLKDPTVSQRQDENRTNSNFFHFFHRDFGKVTILGIVSCSQKQLGWVGTWVQFISDLDTDLSIVPVLERTTILKLEEKGENTT